MNKPLNNAAFAEQHESDTGIPAMQGQRIPSLTIRARRDGEWVEHQTDTMFGGRRVVVFALPGAFTPTCSSTHVPRYNELAPALAECGIDEIVCVSVNDPFVMESWQRDQGANQLTFLPDGNGAFSQAMGMLVDKEDLNFGMRSWRYSMLVNDGVVEKMFVEPQQPGDPFEVSDADTMLNYLNADYALPPVITVVSKPGCSHCDRARQALDNAGLHYENIELGSAGLSLSTLEALSGARTTPQVFADGVKLGGADDLQTWLAERQR